MPSADGVTAPTSSPLVGYEPSDLDGDVAINVDALEDAEPLAFSAAIAGHLSNLHRLLVEEHERCSPPQPDVADDKNETHHPDVVKQASRVAVENTLYGQSMPVRGAKMVPRIAKAMSNTMSSTSTGGTQDPELATTMSLRRMPTAESDARGLSSLHQALKGKEMTHTFHLWRGWQEKPEISGAMYLTASIKEENVVTRSGGTNSLGQLLHPHESADLDRVIDTVEAKCVLDPNTKKRLLWDVMGILMLMYDLILIPLSLSFAIEISGGLLIMSYITLGYWMGDIFMSCITGYFARDGNLVTDVKLILRRYAFSWLSLDVTVVAIDLYTIVVDGQRDAAGVFRAGRMLRMLRVLRTLRLLRLAKLRQLIMVIQDNMDSEYTSTVFNILKYIIVIIIINHFVACGWYNIGNSSADPGESWVYANELHDRSVVYQYLTSVHWSLTQFTPASIDVQPKNSTERFYAILVLLFALCVFSSFLGSISAAMTHLRNITFNYDKQMWLLRKYLREQGVSRKLAVRIHTYVTVIAAMRSKRVPRHRVELLAFLSEPLQAMLQTDLFKPKLAVHPFFAALKYSVLSKICAQAVVQESLSRDDVLFTPGQAGDSMFFLHLGLQRYVVSINTHRRFDVHAGDHFCEAVLWTEWMHVGRMVSLRESDIVKLIAKEFRSVVKEYPLHTQYAKSYAILFVKGLNQTCQDRTVTDLQIKMGDELRADMQALQEDMDGLRAEA